MRALALEPGERTPTAQALQVELETFARQERLEVSTVALGAFMQTLFADDLASLARGAARGQVARRSPRGARGAPPARTDGGAHGHRRVRRHEARRARAAAGRGAAALAAIFGAMAAVIAFNVVGTRRLGRGPRRRRPRVGETRGPTPTARARGGAAGARCLDSRTRGE